MHSPILDCITVTGPSFLELSGESMMVRQNLLYPEG